MDSIQLHYAQTAIILYLINTLFSFINYIISIYYTVLLNQFWQKQF
jgi:hypothetical protein